MLTARGNHVGGTREERIRRNFLATIVYWPAFGQTVLPCIKYDSTLSTPPCLSGSDLKGSSPTGTYVYVAGYFDPADGGQGGFTQMNGTSCADGGGSVIKDSSNKCWYRQNLDGSVEQFDAVPVTSGDGNSTGYSSFSSFTSAIKAAHIAGLGTVYVRGRPVLGTCTPAACGGSRYYLDNGSGSGAALTILHEMKLQCLTAPAGQSENSAGQSQGDYNSIPFTLIVPSTQTILLGQASQLQGCEIQQAGLHTPPGGTATFSAGIYSNKASGFPGKLIAGGTGTISRKNSCARVNISIPPTTLNRKTKYWIEETMHNQKRSGSDFYWEPDRYAKRNAYVQYHYYSSGPSGISYTSSWTKQSEGPYFRLK